ncbi:phage portal protein [Ancylobacter dichloromethanicus]
MMMTRDHADFHEAAVTKGRIEACFAGFVKNTEGEPIQVGSDGKASPSTGLPVQTIEPGMLHRLNPGEDVVFSQPTSSPIFDSFMVHTLMAIAIGAGVTYDQLTGDLRQANYSSLRAGKIEFRRLVEQIQYHVIIPMLCMPTWRKFIETAILTGALPRRPEGYPVDWITPANEPIDPVKDMTADILAVRSGRMTVAQFFASWGNDPMTQLDEIQKYNKLLDDMSIVLDIDPRKVARAGSAQPTTPPRKPSPLTRRRTSPFGDNRMKRSATVPRSTPDGFEPGASVNRQATDDMLARLAPGSYNSTARSVEAIFSTGARVRRWGIYEELAVSPESVDLGRVAQGQVRLLDTHDSSSIDKVLGVVVSARAADGHLTGVIRFADTEPGRRAEAMVQSGDLVGISVGYRVTTWTLTSTENDQEVWRADRWELLEVSLVAVPADPGAMVRSEPANPTLTRADAHNEENDEMRRNLSPAGAAPVAPPLAAPHPCAGHARRSPDRQCPGRCDVARRHPAQ